MLALSLNSRSAEVSCRGDLLCRYVYGEGERPYFHPVRTLAGVTVTDHAPADHPWHQGLAFTAPLLDGVNFWGGPTYVRGAGYVERDDHGRVEHCGWRLVAADPERVRLRQRLAWLDPWGRGLLDEQRSIQVRAPDAGGWTLECTFVLRNVTGHAVAFGSPTTEGRPAAGYGGLFWRGAPDQAGGSVAAAGGLRDDEAMGQPARRLTYRSARTALLFVDRGDPTDWFVRRTPYAGVSFSPAFHRRRPLPPGATLRLSHAVTVADRSQGSQCDA